MLVKTKKLMTVALAAATLTTASLALAGDAFPAAVATAGTSTFTAAVSLSPVR
jgi:hypothetical protein